MQAERFLKKIFTGLAILTAAGSVSGCGSVLKYPYVPEYPPIPGFVSDRERTIRIEADRWKGVPYRYGGESRNGIDCSGLSRAIYQRVYGVRLPRTTTEQARMGRPVPSKMWMPGDLVFFRKKGRFQHVGIYLGRGRFVHASQKEGVIISSIQEPYWRAYYWTSRRVL